MPQGDSIQAEGTVVEVLSSRLFKVDLANGHRLYGHLARKLAQEQLVLVSGDKVLLELTPFDLSKGRIVKKVNYESSRVG